MTIDNLTTLCKNKSEPTFAGSDSSELLKKSVIIHFYIFKELTMISYK